MQTLVVAAVLGSVLVVGAGAAATPGAGLSPTVLPGSVVAWPTGARDQPSAPAPRWSASDTSDETPGCAGVAVVVDGGALDGAALGPLRTVACATVDAPVTAHDAVSAAGVELQGTEQWGAAFVCRVDGRPAVDEDVRRADGSVGTEPCVRTPSQGAYWALWTSTDGSTWTYATRGAASLEVVPGDAVGLVFVTSDQAVPPQVSPADALSGAAPEGWSVDTGPSDATAGAPLDEGQATDGRQEGPGGTASEAVEDVDGSVGAVALVGLGLAGALLCLVGVRTRVRRP